MARPLRGQSSGHAYHVINRGNGGTVVFYKEGDYRAILTLLDNAKARYPVKVLPFCPSGGSQGTSLLTISSGGKQVDLYQSWQQSLWPIPASRDRP